MHTTSPSLLQRLRTPGQADAWARFVQLYSPLIYYWGRRAGLQETDASDLVQEVFAVLLRKLPAFEYDGRRTFRGWLRVVTLNKWKEARRRRAAPTDAEADLADLSAPAQAEALWDQEYRQHLVGRALEVMKADFQPATWQACWAHVVEGKPAAQVAAELNLSANAVYLATSRVLRRLRAELDGLWD
jgi:RNA polymerase sigma-70 factor (ECF subfamily)